MIFTGLAWDFPNPYKRQYFETGTSSAPIRDPPPSKLHYQTSSDAFAGVKEVSIWGWEERANGSERRLSRQRERNTHKQWRADNEEMKGKGGAGLRANDGKDFKAPALAASMSTRGTRRRRTTTERRRVTEGKRIQRYTWTVSMEVGGGGYFI